jgi:hypothetical protein
VHNLVGKIEGNDSTGDGKIAKKCMLEKWIERNGMDLNCTG